MEQQDNSDPEVIRIQMRQYYHRELPQLLGIKSVWLLNVDLKPHRTSLGPRSGQRWNFNQVRLICKILGIPHVIIAAKA